MPKPKPVYKVNPAINPNTDIMAKVDDTLLELQEAFDKTARLLHEAIVTVSPFCTDPQCEPIEPKVDYVIAKEEIYKRMDDTLVAIREKYTEWYKCCNQLDANRIIYEISDLLKKAGY